MSERLLQITIDAVLLREGEAEQGRREGAFEEEKATATLLGHQNKVGNAQNEKVDGFLSCEVKVSSACHARI